MFAGQAIEHAYIGYIHPAGGQMGTSVDVLVGGNDIYGATAARVTGKGVTVQVVDSADPRNLTEEEKRKLKRRSKSVIDEKVRLRLTIASDAEPGERNLCLITPDGASNQRVFQVGQLKELRENEPNNQAESAQALPPLPVTVNGQIMPGDQDHFSFTARKGQRLVAEVAARTLIPYIADAVPGWFQAIVRITDAQGREVACADSFRFSQDPVLFLDVPADGTYTLTIRDSIWRGRADFVYRFRLGELPYITQVFPLGAQRGAGSATVELGGRNLPMSSISVTMDQSPALLRQLTVTGKGGLLSNRVPFAVGDLAEVREATTPSTAAAPQEVTLPITVNGRIRAPGESDWYRFQGRRGQAVAIEVKARRLGSPLDAYLELRNSRGETVAENDDAKDKGEGVITHQADAQILCKLPEDGAYTVRLYDLQGKGGEDHAYRLRFGPYAPDFELRATPAAVEVARGGSAQVTVHVIRRDGFSGPVAVAFAKPAPAGLTLDGGSIPAGVDRIRMTISADAKTRASASAPRLEGVASVEGRPVTRPVVFAEEQMQAFIYQHLVPSREAMLMVTDPPAPFSIVPQLPAKGWLEVAPDRDVSCPITVTRQPGYDGPIKLNLLDPPEGITLLRGFIAPGRTSGTITIEVAETVKPGLCENLIIYGMTFVEPPAGSEKAAAAQAAKKAAKAPTVAAKPEDAKPTDPKEALKKKLAGMERLIEGMPAIPVHIVAAPENVRTTGGTTTKKNR